jgi:hypothetical protein
MSAEVLSKLASSLLDGTVFQIVRELEEIQQLKERNLLNGRMKMLSNHKKRRTEMATRHRSAITLASATERPRLVTEQQEEKDKLETELEADIIQSDQDTILSLDQLLTEQQSTLQRAGVPLMFITNRSEDVQLQMQVLEWTQRLAALEKQ